MPSGEVNYVHEDEIWRQQLKTEVEVASVWKDNWGFLAAREPPRVPDRRHDRAPTRAISCRLYYTAPFFLSSLPTSDHALTHSDSLVPLRPLRAGSAS